MIRRQINVLMKSERLAVLIIFLFALIVRVVALDKLPGGFHEDEVSNAYVGRFILQNGKDLYGNIFPLLYFDKFGDFPPVLPMYLSGAGVMLFGSNEFGARFLTSLLGALTVYPVFYLAKRLFFSKYTAYSSAIFISILPWHIVFSRSAAEGIMAVFVYLGGLYYLFEWISKKQTMNFMYANILFVFTYILYPSFRLLIPLTIFYFLF